MAERQIYRMKAGIVRIVFPWLSDLAGAWIFYSVLPAWPWPRPRFERIARFAPWIGLWIGVLQALLWWGLSGLGWSDVALAPVVIAGGIWLGGGLHHDGLMDTADGLAAGAARRLEAMEDSRVGASGALALAVVLLLQLAALLQLHEQAPLALILAGFWGRVSPLWAMARFNYLRSDGTAGFHRRYGQPWWDVVPTVVACLAFAPFVAPLPLLIGAPVAVGVAERLGRRLGGHTGDSYGAVEVVTEVITLLLLAGLAAAN